MHFICKHHQQNLFNQSYDELMLQWFEWMDQASMYYEVGLHQQVLAYAGSSVDLSLILMGKAADTNKANAARKLVLACIYLTNCLALEKEHQKARFYQAAYHQVLQGYFKTVANTAEAKVVKESIEVLADTQSHNGYLNKHLNLEINNAATSPAIITFH